MKWARAALPSSRATRPRRPGTKADGDALSVLPSEESPDFRLADKPEHYQMLPFDWTKDQQQ